MSKRYVFKNPNPSGAEIGDCVVRAISLALEQSWEDTYSDLCQLGASLYRMPNDRDTYRTYLTSAGFIRTGISNKKGSKRPTVSSFAAAHKTGTYVLEVAHHIVCVRDGKYYDIWDSGDKSLYGYWEKPAG